MVKSSRRYRELLQKITKPLYSPSDAVELLLELSNAKFIETVDLHIVLG